VASFGTGGNQSGQFNLPTSVIIDSQGDLYVNERGNDRIQKLDSDGNPILMWGSKGSGYSQFCHMEHLAIDKFDNIYVTEIHSRFQDVAMKLDPPNLTETVILSHNGNFLECRKGPI
jgi:hypothetical protein